MAVIYAFLVLRFGTGELFHEAFGILFGVLYIIHLLLNAGWIKNTVGKDFKKLPERDRTLLVIDIILFAGLVVIMITGISIAYELYDLNIGDGYRSLYNVHNISSYAVLGIISLHLLIHAKYLFYSIKSIIHNIASPQVRHILEGSAAALTVVAIVYNLAFPTLKTETELLTEIQRQTLDSCDSDIPETEETVPVHVKKKEEDADETASVSSETSNDDDGSNSMTLSQYLSTLFCNGCGRHCSLLTPHCNKGMQKAEDAKQTYEAEYGDGK